jgi:hypothetical protein
MEHPNPIEHNGFTISATAIERQVGNWTAFCVLEKDGAVVFRGENAYALPTRAAAERHAIVIGRSIANGDLRGLP